MGSCKRAAFCEKKICHIPQRMEATERELLSALTPAEREIFVTLLRKVRDSLT